MTTNTINYADLGLVHLFDRVRMIFFNRENRRMTAAEINSRISICFPGELPVEIRHLQLSHTKWSVVFELGMMYFLS